MYPCIVGGATVVVSNTRIELISGHRRVGATVLLTDIARTITITHTPI